MATIFTTETSTLGLHFLVLPDHFRYKFLSRLWTASRSLFGNCATYMATPYSYMYTDNGLPIPFYYHARTVAGSIQNGKWNDASQFQPNISPYSAYGGIFPIWTPQPGDYKEMSSILANNSALVYEPKCWGGGGEVAGSQPMSTAVHRSPNKLWRSNSNVWRSPISGTLK